MLRSTKRWISRTSLPHPWFEMDHHLLKPDIELQKIIRARERMGGLAEPTPEVDTSYMEFNQETTPLYDVSKQDFEAFPEYLSMFIRFYANYNPDLVINNALEHPSVPFNTRIQKLEEFDRNYTVNEIENLDRMDSRYIISRFTPPKFKQLMDVVLSKVPLHGSMVPMNQYQAYSDLNYALDKVIFAFHFGEGAFFSEEEELTLKRLMVRQMSSGDWLDKRDIPFVTEAEHNFLLGMINWPGSEEHEYRCTYRPYFKDFEIEQSWVFRDRSLAKLTKGMWLRKIQKPRTRADIIGRNIMERLKCYLSCPEFRMAFILPSSFVARNNLLILHVWLMNERLTRIAADIMQEVSKITWKDYLFDSEIRRQTKNSKKVLKFIAFLNEKLKTMFRTQTERSLYRVKVHPSQRRRIKTVCEKQAEQVTYLLYKHFMSDNKEYDQLNPLMQLIFFPQNRKSTQYSSFVFEIAEYVQKHREYLKTLTLEDFQACAIDWDVMRMDKKSIQARMKQQFEFTDELSTDLTQEDLKIISDLETDLEQEEPTREDVPKKPSYPKDEKYKPLNK